LQVETRVLLTAAGQSPVIPALMRMKKQRPKYEPGDYVLYTERRNKRSATGMHTKTVTYITRIEEVRFKPGSKPYLIRGFNYQVGRKELNAPTNEHILRYKLMSIRYAIPLDQL
jgi:hypothetical protein